MLGLFSSLFLDFVARKYDHSIFESIPAATGIPKMTVFNEHKTYSDEDWQRLFNVLCDNQDLQPDMIEEAFAHYFFKFTRDNFLTIYQQYLSSKELITDLQNVHRKAIQSFMKSKKQEIENSACYLKPSSTENNTIAIYYCSPNKLCRFLEVFAKDVIHFYGDEARVEHLPYCMKNGDDQCEIHITWEKLK